MEAAAAGERARRGNLERHGDKPAVAAGKERRFSERRHGVAPV